MSILAAVTEPAQKLPVPPLAFGIVAISLFAVLLLGTLSLRNISRRH